jgi:hypothetical protein
LFFPLDFRSDFRSEETKMIGRIASAIFASTLFVGTAIAQSAAPSDPPKDTSCTNATGNANSGNSEQKTANSMAMEKSAVLPNASGHANSAAPTVQSGGKPMEVRKDCPPDAKGKS